MEKITAVE